MYPEVSTHLEPNDKTIKKRSSNNLSLLRDKRSGPPPGSTLPRGQLPITHVKELEIPKI